MTCNVVALPLRIATAVLMAVTLLTGCKGCEKKTAALATLAETQGQVDRDHAAKTLAWQGAKPGETFLMGDGIKTSQSATARLMLADGSSLAMQENAVLRFLASLPNQPNFKVELGEVWVQAGAAPLNFGSAVGLAVLEAGGRMVVKQEGRKTRYEVIVGIANFTKEGGETLQLLAGQRISVDLETALIERLPSETVAKPAAATTPPAPSREPPTEGDIAAIVAGQRVRYRATPKDKWAAIEPGNHAVAAGGSFDIPARATVRVARGSEAATMHGRGQFRVGGEAGLVETTLGRVTVDRSVGETVIIVPGGSIAVRADGSTADVSVDANRASQLRVRQGTALVQTATGSDEINVGEVVRVDAQGHMQVDGRGPETADLSVTAGESFVVHDPTPPTAVEVKFPTTCGQGARLRIGASRFVVPRKTSEGTAIANLTPGTHRYAVLCAGAPETVGSIQITRDPGTADLPRLAPATIVDVDGRKYTILYQNLLPEVRVSWPKAPKSAQYQLVLTSGNASKTFTTNKPKYTFKSSAIPEGNHTFVFTALDASATSSPETSVKIRFDNAAPAAVVRMPQNRAFKAGDTVDVAGSALPGWVVTAQGAALPLDPNRRFAGQVTAAAERRALAIRFEHKERGVHYYLRRWSGRLP